MNSFEQNVISYKHSGCGIYIHVPFCKQACHYCDFHFSTSITKKKEMILAFAKEIELRKNEMQDNDVATIYFGGGTPSMLLADEISFLIEIIYLNFRVIEKPEITIEANPDDLSEDYLNQLSKTKINRLSIGIQSFFEADLKLMNRVHSASEAKKSLEIATQFFDNISIDLIYGIPGLTHEMWIKNIETALFFGVKHISCYALTVEPKTALKKLIATGKIAAPKDDLAQQQFEMVTNLLQKNDFIHYELSNFGKPNFFSKNNTAYWLGNSYLGIGPSAHSFDGVSRKWNIANNNLYLKALLQNKSTFETETLSTIDRYNEYVMTGLRTIWGIDLMEIEEKFGEKFKIYTQKQSEKHLENGLLIKQQSTIKTSVKGKFLCDGLASDLFFVNELV
jgi:oxygen-independent coproporphyrinogen III oxidase